MSVKLARAHLASWDKGVITGAKGDMLPPNASPFGKNAQLDYIASGALVRRRKGATTVSAAPLSGEPEILGIFPYYYGAQQTLVVADDGTLNSINVTTGAWTVLATPFTAGTYYPDCAVANSMAVIVNGQENKKVVGTAVSGFGISAPSAPTVVDSGVAGNPNGTYEFALVATNGTTGSESALGTIASVAVVNTKITVSWTFPTDPQVTKVKVAVRKDTLSPNFFFIPDSGISVTPLPTGGYPSTTVSISFNATDGEMGLMALLAPTATENLVAPTFQCVEYHKGRIFGANGADLYWSKLDNLEGFEGTANETVGKGDGDTIVGLQTRREGLVIWKHRSIWLLEGDGPNDFTLTQIAEGTGLVSVRAQVTLDNTTYWWCPASGPRRWGQEGFEKLAIPGLLPTVQTLLATTEMESTCVGLDTLQQHLLFAVPGQSQERNTLILPYSLSLNVWMSEYWDPFEVAAIGLIPNQGGIDTLYMGGYLGDLYQWALGESDGIGTGLKEGTLLASAGVGSTTLTLTTGYEALPSRLAGRVVIFEDPATYSTMRFVIGASSATSVTLRGTDSTTLAMDTTWTWTLGGPDFVWDTKDLVHDAPFERKRYTFVNIFFESVVGTFTLQTTVYLNHTINPPHSTVLGSFSGAGASPWDVALFDTYLWGPTERPMRRFRVSQVGNAIRVRVRNHQPDVAFLLRAIQVDAEILTEKGVTTDES